MALHKYMPYLPCVTLPNQSYSSFLSFIVGFVKQIISYSLLVFLSLQVRGTIFFFILFLFGLQARSALYHLYGFYNTAFCSPMLVHILYEIYNYFP